MGQCYTVYLKLKFKDEDGAKKALRDELSKHFEDIDEFGKKRGLDYSTMDGLLRHFYTSWEWGNKWTECADPEWLCGDFNASYSWESIMMNAFDLMAPFLEDGSEIKIYPDSGLDRAIVRNGKADWVS